MMIIKKEIKNYSLRNENNCGNNRINNGQAITSKCFEYKAKIVGIPQYDNNTLDVEVVVPLKYLSNFWRSLDLLLITCEIELDLSWSKEAIISEISITLRVPLNPDANPSVQKVAAIQTTGETNSLNDAKLYVTVVTLSINDNTKSK